MQEAIDSNCLKIICMDKGTYYLPKIDENIIGAKICADHGVTQGINSSCNIFSFYISYMKEVIKNVNTPDFTEPNNMLQLADDTIQYNSLVKLFARVFNYGKNKYIVITWTKRNTVHPRLSGQVGQGFSKMWPD